MDRRRAKRAKTYQLAKMSVDRDGFDLCVVHDRTDRGLCIELAFGADCLPDAFELSFDRFRTSHACKVIWRDDRSAGIEFCVAPPASLRKRRAVLRVVAG